MPQCPVCRSEVGADYLFCNICGTRLPLAPTGGAVPAPESGPVAPQPTRYGTRIAAIVIIILLVTAVLIFVAIPTALTSHSSTSTLPAGCPPVTTSTAVAAPTPNYDVQEVMVFAQSYSEMEFNVTAVAQCDSSGYGPSYILNGLTNTGYWYQVGINWNWPLQSGGYTPGFGFVSEAWAPGGLTRSPPSVAFSGIVNQGDEIELSLAFSGGQVVASATDLKTGASGSMSYPSRGANAFIGSQEQQQSQPRFSFATQGYFTGLMTEWYHVSPTGNATVEAVTYSESQTVVLAATLAVGEWNFTTSVPTSVFSDEANNGSPIDFAAQPNQLEQFTLGGYSLAADGYEFVTGS